MREHLNLICWTVPLVAILLIGVSSPFSGAPPGDAASLRIVGASPDGSYLAYETFGVIDGAPLFYSYITVLDVQHNRWAEKPVRVEVGETGSLANARSMAREQASDKLRKYNIREHELDNERLHLLVNQLFTDVGADPHRVRFSVGTPNIGVYHELYDMDLVQYPAGSTCENFGEAKLLELTVGRSDSGASSVLQRDTRLPESRGCALDYRIERVYHVPPRRLVVFLNVMVPGFEGRSMRYMAVSGQLP